MKNGLIAIVMLAATGCATLQSLGIVKADTLEAACKDVIATCSNPALAAYPQAKTYCDGAIAACVVAPAVTVSE